MSLLETIRSPADLKTLDRAQLDELAAEMRHAIIQTVARNAGHLAPNLGVIELSLALHRVFDSPADRIVWDVGHQSYPHKLLTGRFERFHTLRQRDGLAGYPNRAESEHDPFGTCHGSTSISAALGMAVARDLKGEKHHVIAVIGDGALTGGMAYEGLNNVGELRKRMIIVLNDNEMSISPNIGAIHRYLTKLTTSRMYMGLERDVWELLGKLPTRLGKAGREMASRIKEGLQGLVVPGVLFEELGIKYFGPIDGHDYDVLEETLSDLRRFDEPVLLHVVTRKGRGYGPAEGDRTKFHGVGTFDPDTGTTPKGSKVSYTHVFGRTAIDIAEALPNAVAITAAMSEGTGLVPFSKRFPERFFDVGMAEEHAVTFSGGLASAGMRPLTAIYSTFLQRGFDQVIHDVAVQGLGIVLCIDRAGLVGEDGAPQHGAYDIGFLRMIPGVTIMQPRNGEELRDMLWTAAHAEGIVAVRYPRANIPEGELPVHAPRLLPIGASEQLRAGGDVALLALGTMVQPALDAAEALAAGGVSATVVNARFASPVDARAVTGLARSVGRLVTLEENVLAGGFGSAVHECLEQHELATTPLLRIGLPETFVAHGKRDGLLHEVGLDAEGIARRVLDWIRASQRQFA